MKKSYYLSLDQGTTSSRAIVFDSNFNVLAIEQIETSQIFPSPGLVEQDALEIRETQFFVARKAIAKSGIDVNNIAGIGITNQRETTILWDKNTGKPVYNAIIWQDKRTSEICNKIRQSETGKIITKKTGLIVDSYFSATKIHWILNNVPGIREKALKGEILFGTVDTWLIWNLSGRKLHVTDYSNASRTMLFNIETLTWDKELLDFFEIPEIILPKVVDSSGICGQTKYGILGDCSLNISGIAGDQQSALFGQTCFEPGTVKNTYGTGCFMLMNTGYKIVRSNYGLLSTIAWKIGNQTVYAVEGSVFIAGAVIQWLRDKLGIIKNADQTEDIAKSIPDAGGVFFVPAFSGLGAPYWSMDAKGIIYGITAGTTEKQIIRAAIESMAYQTRDVIEAMKKDSDIEIKLLNVDGGAAKNNFLLQFQADILNVKVLRPKNVESTALGAAMLVAIASGEHDFSSLVSKREIDKYFIPNFSEEKRNILYSQWLNVVSKIL